MQFIADIRAMLRREPLEEDRLERLWGAMLDDAIDDVEVGAILAALAVSGESRLELRALHRAVTERMPAWTPALDTRAVCIPSYGVVPGEAVFVTLAAVLLRRFEIPVVVHGLLDAPHGTSAACVLRELGVLPCGSLAQADDSLALNRIAFLPASLLAPRLHRLVSLRNRLGIDTCAQLVAQSLAPTRGPCVGLALSTADTASCRVDALCLAVGGEFVALAWPEGRTPASLSTRPRIERWSAGTRELLFEADVQRMRSSVPQPPEDAAGIARWVRRVVTGAIPVPVPAVNLVAACLYALGDAPDFSRAKAIAAVSAGRLAA